MLLLEFLCIIHHELFLHLLIELDLVQRPFLLFLRLESLFDLVSLLLFLLHPPVEEIVSHAYGPEKSNCVCLLHDTLVFIICRLKLKISEVDLH